MAVVQVDHGVIEATGTKAPAVGGPAMVVFAVLGMVVVGVTGPTTAVMVDTRSHVPLNPAPSPRLNSPTTLLYTRRLRRLP